MNFIFQSLEERIASPNTTHRPATPPYGQVRCTSFKLNEEILFTFTNAYLFLMLWLTHRS
jgi:hypothetical protein